MQYALTDQANIKQIAHRVYKEDCRAVILGDSNSVKYLQTRLIEGFCRALKPDRWVGRMSQGVSNGSVVGTPIFTFGAGVGRYAEIEPTGTTLYGMSGVTPFTASNVELTGTLGFGSAILQTYLNGTGVGYQDGNWWAGRHVNARFIYFANTGCFVTGLASTHRGGVAQYGTTQFLLSTGSVLNNGLAGINYIDHYCGSSGNVHVELRISSANNVSGKFLTHYGTQWYEVASSGGAAVSGFSLDSIGQGGWSVAKHLDQTICPSGRVREYFKCIRDPNLFIVLLGQGDTYATGTWRTNVQSMVDMYRGIALTNNPTDPPYFLFLSTWDTYAGDPKWDGERRDLLAIARSNSDVGFINVGKLLGSQRYIAEQGYFDPAEVPAGVHLSAKGYRRVAEIVEQVLHGALADEEKTLSTRANKDNTRYKKAYFPEKGVQMPYSKVQHEITTDVQIFMNEPLTTTSGYGYPTPDIGGKTISNRLDLNGRPMYFIRSSGINAEIVDGSGDRSFNRNYNPYRAGVTFTRGGGGVTQ